MCTAHCCQMWKNPIGSGGWGGVKRSDWSDTEACCFILVTCACTPYSTWNKDKDVCIFCRHLRTTLVCTKTMKKSESREWIRADPLFEFATQTRRPAWAWTQTHVTVLCKQPIISHLSFCPQRHDTFLICDQLEMTWADSSNDQLQSGLGFSLWC